MNYLTITKCIKSALIEESEEYESSNLILNRKTEIKFYFKEYSSPTKFNILNSPQSKDTMRDNYMILNSNADSLLKYVSTDACNGLNILTVSIQS
jgi:hypothetical protein